MEKNLKINVVGCGGGGKSRLVISFGQLLSDRGVHVENLTAWNEDLVSTVGGHFVSFGPLPNDKEHSFTVWDLGGQVRYADVRKVYLEGTHGILAVVDLTRAYSLYVLKEAMLKNEVKQVCDDNIPIIIVGNKTDLREALLAEKSKIARVLTERLELIIQSRKETFEIEVKIGKKRGLQKISANLHTLGDRPALKVADFEAAIYSTLLQHYSELPFTNMNLKLLAREIWFVLTNELFQNMLGSDIPYRLIERASLGSPLFKEFSKDPDVLIPIDWNIEQVESFIEKIIISSSQLKSFTDEMIGLGFNISQIFETSAVTKEYLEETFKTVFKEAKEFKDIQIIPKDPMEDVDFDDL